MQKENYTTLVRQTKSVKDVKKEDTEKHRLYHCPCRKEGSNQIPEDLVKMGAKGQDFKERLKVAERHHVTPSQCEGHLEDEPSNSAKVESETQKLRQSSRRLPEPCCH